MTDVAEAPQAPETEATQARRGRPRPGETLERDQRVLAAIAEGGSTRDDIAKSLGDDISPALVYLSLHRLRAAGKVERMRDGGKHTWKATAANAPASVG